MTSRRGVPLRLRILALWLGGACTLLACAPDDRIGRVTPQSLNTAQGSLAPNLSVFHDTLLLSWVQPGPDSLPGLWYSRWTGADWEPGRPVAGGSHWVVHWADIPKVQMHDGGLVAVWLERMGTNRQAYGVKFARLLPGEAAFSASAWMHTDTRAAEHGFVSLVPLDDAVQAVWLDGGETSNGGSMTLRTARLTNRAAPVDETLLDERVCDCCPTAAVRCGDGSILVAYRDRSALEVRDIAITRFADSTWSTPRTLYRDEWKIAGCPVNGPALAASDSQVAVAWFTMSGGVDPTVNVVFSADYGRTFGAPVRVDRRHAEGQVDVTWLDDGRALVVWMESSDSTGGLWARAVRPGVPADSAILVTELKAERSSGIPSVASLGHLALVAWTESAVTTQVKTAVVRP